MVIPRGCGGRRGCGRWDEAMTLGPATAARGKYFSRMQEGDGRGTRRWFGTKDRRRVVLAPRPFKRSVHLRASRPSADLSARDFPLLFRIRWRTSATAWRESIFRLPRHRGMMRSGMMRGGMMRGGMMRGGMMRGNGESLGNRAHDHGLRDGGVWQLLEGGANPARDARISWRAIRWARCRRWSWTTAPC
jgi:hypothetical protein